MSDTTLTTGFTRDAMQRLASRGGRYMASLRAEALDLFEALPIPSQETEEWRYTDLSGLDLSFTPSVPGRGRGATAEGDGPAGASTVMSTSNQDVAARGVIFCDLDEAARAHPELVERHLHRLVPTSRTKFTALHGAFRAGGTFLYVPRGVIVELPLQTLSSLSSDGAAVFPHTLLVADEDSEVTFIDRFASPDVGSALSDAVTEIVVGRGARVRYVSIQEWGVGVTHLGVQRAHVDRDAEFRSLSLGFGASLARAETEAILLGEGGFSEMLGIFFADETQHFDHRTEQDHAARNCTSDLLYKGALRDESSGVYSGWVHVRPGAQKTNAMQTSRNILLSEGAFGRAIPNLEIEANDVRCGHAASVGPVDDEQLFYLMSRGIPRDEAERLIVFGFFNEVLERIALNEVRESATAAIEAELARGG
jgi:Fe-S cluster assembly protein SufD